MLKQLISSGILGISLLAGAQAQPFNPYQAHYDVLRGGSSHGEALRQLEQSDEGIYTLRTVTDISWLFLSDKRSHRSEFSVLNRDESDSLQLQTHAFDYQRTGTGSDKAFAATFDHEQQVVLDQQQQPLSLEWSSDLMDEGTMVQQLQHDLAQSEQAEFDYRIVDEKGYEDQMLFVRGQTETLSLPYGEIEAIKVERVRENSTRETIYWFAPALDYVLVKMLQREDGDEVATLALKTLTTSSSTPTSG